MVPPWERLSAAPQGPAHYPSKVAPWETKDPAPWQQQGHQPCPWQVPERTAGEYAPRVSTSRSTTAHQPHRATGIALQMAGAMAMQQRQCIVLPGQDEDPKAKQRRQQQEMQRQLAAQIAEKNARKQQEKQHLQQIEEKEEARIRRANDEGSLHPQVQHSRHVQTSSGNGEHGVQAPGTAMHSEFRHQETPSVAAICAAAIGSNSDLEKDKKRRQHEEWQRMLAAQVEEAKEKKRLAEKQRVEEEAREVERLQREAQCDQQRISNTANQEQGQHVSRHERAAERHEQGAERRRELRHTKERMRETRVDVGDGDEQAAPQQVELRKTRDRLRDTRDDRLRESKAEMRKTRDRARESRARSRGSRRTGHDADSPKPRRGMVQSPLPPNTQQQDIFGNYAAQATAYTNTAATWYHSSCYAGHGVASPQALAGQTSERSLGLHAFMEQQRQMASDLQKQVEEMRKQRDDAREQALKAREDAINERAQALQRLQDCLMDKVRGSEEHELPQGSHPVGGMYEPSAGSCRTSSRRGRAPVATNLYPDPNHAQESCASNARPQASGKTVETDIAHESSEQQTQEHRGLNQCEQSMMVCDSKFVGLSAPLFASSLLKDHTMPSGDLAASCLPAKSEFCSVLPGEQISVQTQALANSTCLAGKSEFNIANTAGAPQEFAQSISMAGHSGFQTVHTGRSTQLRTLVAKSEFLAALPEENETVSPVAQHQPQDHLDARDNTLNAGTTHEGSVTGPQRRPSLGEKLGAGRPPRAVLAQSKAAEFRKALVVANGMDPALRDGIFELLNCARPLPDESSAPSKEKHVANNDACKNSVGCGAAQQASGHRISEERRASRPASGSCAGPFFLPAAAAPGGVKHSLQSTSQNVQGSFASTGSLAQAPPTDGHDSLSHFLEKTRRP